jgi:hypothetical protein
VNVQLHHQLYEFVCLRWLKAWLSECKGALAGNTYLVDRTHIKPSLVKPVVEREAVVPERIPQLVEARASEDIRSESTGSLKLVTSRMNDQNLHRAY